MNKKNIVPIFGPIVIVIALIILTLKGVFEPGHCAILVGMFILFYAQQDFFYVSGTIVDYHCVWKDKYFPLNAKIILETGTEVEVYLHEGTRSYLVSKENIRGYIWSGRISMTDYLFT